MKKQKTITLKSSEEVALDSLTDREKMIYEAGYDEGANAAMIVGFIFIAAILLVSVFWN